MSRVIYSIDQDVLSRFNARFSRNERSKVVERLMCQALEEKDRLLVEAIKRIESDPRFASIREVSDDIDRVAGEAVE